MARYIRDTWWHMDCYILCSLVLHSVLCDVLHGVLHEVVHGIENSVCMYMDFPTTFVEKWHVYYMCYTIVIWYLMCCVTLLQCSASVLHDVLHGVSHMFYMV